MLEDPNRYDVEPRRKFRASEAGQFILTLLLLIFSGKLLADGPKCSHLETWNSIIFYGAITWIVYLVITLVVQFRNEAMRLFLGYVDYLFVLFLAAMWIWNLFIYNQKEVLACAPRWQLAARVFNVTGWIVIACIIAVIFMSILRIINKKAAAGKPELDSHRHGDYEILDQSAL